MTTQKQTTLTAAQRRALKAEEAKRAKEAEIEAARIAEANAKAEKEDSGGADEGNTPDADVQLNEGEGLKAEVADNGVQPESKTLAEATQEQLDNNVIVNPPATTIAELAKDSKAFAETTVDLGNGVTISGRTNEVEQVTTARTETVEDYIRSKYNLEPEAYSTALKRTIKGFETYHMYMNARAPVTLEEAAKHQAAWYRIVTAALDSQLGDSTVCFDVILYLAYRHSDDLFTDRLACRAFNLLPDNIRDTFNLYQTIIVNAANPRTRSRYVSTQINTKLIGNTIRSANQRTNLLAYLASIE